VRRLGLPHLLAAGLSACLGAGCVRQAQQVVVVGPEDPEAVTLQVLMRDRLDSCVKRMQPLSAQDSPTAETFSRLEDLARELEDGAYHIAKHKPPEDTGDPNAFYWRGGVLVSRANELRWACAKRNAGDVRMALQAVVQSCNACHAQYRHGRDVVGAY
jgi:cytochrome c556